MKSTAARHQLRAAELRPGDIVLSPVSKRWTRIIAVEPGPGTVKIRLPHYSFTKSVHSLIDAKD